MATRRTYPGWLPPNPKEREGLLRIERMQKAVLIWLIACLPAGWIVVLVTRLPSAFVPFTLLWIAAGVWLARQVTARRCPRCGDSFCEKSELPYWYGLFNRRCESCGLTLNPERGG